MTWKIERELISTEPVDSKLPAGDMTELSKITATHIETGEVYNLKHRMGTEADKKAAWDNIYAQHEERTKAAPADLIANEGVAYLDKKEVP